MVLCAGALAAGEGAIGEITKLGFSYPYFPFLRRYIPAVPFCAFFAMCALVWLLVTTKNLNKRVIYTVLSSVCFAFLVFSYFYLWTTAAAWLACVGILWLSARPEDWFKDFKAFILLGAGCILSLIPYAVMLANRSQTMDNVQLLVYTREPDLTRVPALISIFVLLVLIVGVLTKTLNLKNRAALFAASFALTVLFVFNQQILTGRALQPIHYQVFIGNYAAATAVVLTFWLFWRKFSENRKVISNIALSVIAIIAVVWGFIECYYTVRVLDDANIARDKTILAAKRLTELGAKSANPNQETILSYSSIHSDDSPTVAPQAVLWARHQHVFAGLNWQESKERYYQYLYYLDTDEKQLEKRLQKGDFVSMIALFGWGRHTDRLSSQAKPLTYGEIAHEAKRYGEYRKNFSIEQASNPKLSYIVIPRDWKAEFTNLDKWYERGEAEILGDYLLYPLKLKNGE